jgi:hypothetical protein
MEAVQMVGKLTDDVMDRIENILNNKPKSPQDFRP